MVGSEKLEKEHFSWSHIKLEYHGRPCRADPAPPPAVPQVAAFFSKPSGEATSWARRHALLFLCLRSLPPVRFVGLLCFGPEQTGTAECSPLVGCSPSQTPAAEHGTRSLRSQTELAAMQSRSPLSFLCSSDLTGDFWTVRSYLFLIGLWLSACIRDLLKQSIID